MQDKYKKIKVLAVVVMMAGLLTGLSYSLQNAGNNKDPLSFLAKGGAFPTPTPSPRVTPVPTVTVPPIPRSCPCKSLGDAAEAARQQNIAATTAMVEACKKLSSKACSNATTAANNAHYNQVQTEASYFNCIDKNKAQRKCPTPYDPGIPNPNCAVLKKNADDRRSTLDYYINEYNHCRNLQQENPAGYTCFDQYDDMWNIGVTDYDRAIYRLKKYCPQYQNDPNYTTGSDLVNHGIYSR